MKLKKLLAVILAVTLLLSTVQFSFAFLTSAGGENEFYVSATGSDTTGDGTQANPYQTIDKVQSLMIQNNLGDTTVKVVGEVAFGGTNVHSNPDDNTYDGMLTIEAVDNSSKLALGWNYKKSMTYRSVLKGDVTLKNIGFSGVKTTDSKTTKIITNGHKLVLDVDSSDAQPTIEVGNFDENSTTKVENIEVNNWPGDSSNGLTLGLVGAASASKRVSAGLNFTANGGYIKALNFTQTKYTGDVNFVYNAFSSTNDFEITLGNKVTFGGALQVIANNGITTDVVGELSGATATDGVWVLYGGAGGKLAPTADEGVYTIEYNSGYISAMATNRATGEDVFATGTTLDLTAAGAGTYDIIYQQQSQGTPTETEKVFYVDADNGNDENNGSTAQKAFKTIERAYSAISSLEFSTNGIVNATVYVKGNGVSFDSYLAHKGTVTIKGADSTAAVLSLANNTYTDSNGATVNGVALKGNTVFDTVRLPELTGTGDKYLISGGYKLVLKNIAAEGGKTYGYHIGYGDSTAADTKEVAEFEYIGGIDSTVNNIIFGAVSNTNKTSAGLDFKLNGGKLSSLSFLNGTTYTGDVNINLVNFVATDKVTFVNNGATFDDAFQFIANNNKKADLSDEAIANISAINAQGGKWIVYSDDTGCSLSATETAGTFKVDGNLYAKATDVTNSENVFYSNSEKILTLPAGTYSVTYVMDLPAVGPVVPEPEKVEKVYYLDTANGSDTNDGLTADKPLKTLEKAQQLAKAFETSDNVVNVTVYLKGELIINTQAHKGMLTIIGLDDTAKTRFWTQHTYLNGPLTLRNVTAIQNGNHAYTNGHEVVLDIQKSGDNNTIGYFIGNASGTNDYSDEKMTVINNKKGWQYGPTKFNIGSYKGSTVSGSVDFLHQSGHIRWIDFDTDTTFKGNVNITIDSFSERTDDNQNYVERVSGNPVFEKAFQVIYNNNAADSVKTQKVFETDAVTAQGGKWIIYAEAGALLRTTKIAGVFAIEGNAKAIATNKNDSSKVYKSTSQGYLVLNEPGVYTVEFDAPDVIIPDKAEPTNIIEKTYYVNATDGNDDNDGLTPETAVLTIRKAQELAASFEDEATDTGVNATIYITGGSVEFDGGVAHRGMFTLVGDGTDSAVVRIKYGNHGGTYGSTLKGPTTIKNLAFLDASSAGNYIITNGHKYILDVSEPGAQRHSLMIGNTDETPELTNENVTIDNVMGEYWKSSSYIVGTFGAEATGNVNFVHNNGHFFGLTFKKDSIIKGTVNLTFNAFGTRGDADGQPRLIVGDNVKFMQAVQVIFNNNLAKKFVKNDLQTATAKRGIWLMYSEEGGTLETTDTYGVFKATSDKTCYAVNKKTFEIYTAVDGILTVPAGEYDVSYRDYEPDVELPYPNANEELNDEEGTVKEYTIYVAPEAEGGSNRKGDGTKEKPYRTIDKAMYVLASIPKETGVIKKGVIVLKGEAEFDGGEPHVNMITIRAWNDTARITPIASGYYSGIQSATLLEGPVTFDGVRISKTTNRITTNGYELAILNGTDKGESSGDVMMNITQINSPADNTKGEKVTVNGWTGSTWGGLYFYIGPTGDVANKSIGKIDVVVTGGKFKRLALYPGIYTDDVNFTWNSGSFTNDGPYYAQLNNKTEGSHIFKGAFQFISNNGSGIAPATQSPSRVDKETGLPTYSPADEANLFVSIQAAKGEWFMFGEKGGQLSMTDTAGTFKVSDGTIATAVNQKDSSKVYKSVNGLLTVPEGFYDVTFEKDIANAIYIDAMTLDTETVGQKVHLVNGKTYKFTFDYRNIQNGIDNNADIAVYSGKTILYSTRLQGDKNIKKTSNGLSTNRPVYEFTFNGTTGDYGVGFAINGDTMFRIYNPILVESTNQDVNLYKNTFVKKSLENWSVSAKTGTASDKEVSVTNGEAFAAIKIGEFYLSDYRKTADDAKALYIKSDGEFSVGTNVELKGGTTYRLVIDNKGINTDFYYDSYVVVRGAYGTDSSSEPYRSKYNNYTNVLPRVDRDLYVSRVVYEFTINSTATYGVGIRVHDTESNKHLYKDFECYIGNMVLYDIGDPYTNLISNSDYTDNLNGWYISEHVEVSNDTGHNLKGTTDAKLDPTATSYGVEGTDPDVLKLVPQTENFFKKLVGDEIGPKKMLYAQNGAGWAALLTRFKEEETLQVNHTYVVKYSIVSDYEYDLVVWHEGNRYNVFDKNPKAIETEEVIGDGYKYKNLTYEFTLPEKDYQGRTLSADKFIGINMGANHAVWIFDFVIYDKDDPRQTNLARNGEFRNNLDDWMIGWSVWFEARSLGFGWTEYPSAEDADDATFKMAVADYDYKNLISYKDDSNVNDGEWWNPDDVVNLESRPETGTVMGTVVNDKGNALKDITVELVSTSDEMVTYKVKTNAKGSFELKDVLADMYKVFLISADGTRRDSETYVTVTDGSIITVDIKVAPAEITADVSTQLRRSTIKGTLYNAKREPLAGITVGVARNRTMVTDENGNFEFENLPAGNYKVFAVNPDGSYYLLRTYALADGQIASLKVKYDPEADKAAANNQANNSNNSNTNNADSNKSDFPWWILIVAGGVLVVGAGVVVLIILLKKKKAA